MGILEEKNIMIRVGPVYRSCCQLVFPLDDENKLAALASKHKKPIEDVIREILEHGIICYPFDTCNMET